jgi:acetolactate synthase small subunit
MLHTISLLVENHFGVLARIAGSLPAAATISRA